MTWGVQMIKKIRNSEKIGKCHEKNHLVMVESYRSGEYYDESIYACGHGFKKDCS
jgi:elongation factor P--beta-lysine ligase